MYGALAGDGSRLRSVIAFLGAWLLFVIAHLPQTWGSWGGLLAIGVAGLGFTTLTTPAAWQAKPLVIRLLEMTALYLVVGAVGFALEANIGTRFPQTWEFYAITACLFVVLAFPGFVGRYLLKRKTARPA